MIPVNGNRHGGTVRSLGHCRDHVYANMLYLVGMNAKITGAFFPH
jgi:hypothetical protein